MTEAQAKQIRSSLEEYDRLTGQIKALSRFVDEWTLKAQTGGKIESFSLAVSGQAPIYSIALATSGGTIHPDLVRFSSDVAATVARMAQSELERLNRLRDAVDVDPVL